MIELQNVSNRDTARESIKYFLVKQHFAVNDILLDGILQIVNQIADYYEEGKKYFPEVVLLNDICCLDAIQGRRITLYTGVQDKDEFSRVMKLSAPLAVNNWSIFIIFSETEMQYGLISCEIKETSLSLYEQLISMAEEDNSIVYIRNIGSKNVELLSPCLSQTISTTLDEYYNDVDKNISSLSEAIIQDCVKDKKTDRLFPFVKKIIYEALNEGHGNLIVVCKSENFIDVTSKMTSGVKLTPPISIPALLLEDEINQTNVSSVSIKSNVSLIKSMINHDGITIFSTEGQVLGFHYIVDNDLVPKKSTPVGGSRTKAFENLKSIDSITARFFKSQDGKTKFA